MKFPRVTTHDYKVLTFLRECPLSLETGIAAHGQLFAKKCDLVSLYKRLVDDGLATVQDDIYTITRRAANWLDGAQEEKYVGQVATSREINVLTSPPIQKKNIPSRLGNREGADDHLLIESRMS